MTTKNMFAWDPIPKIPSLEKQVEAEQNFKQIVKDLSSDVVPELPMEGDPTQQKCPTCKGAVDESTWFVTRVTMMQSIQTKHAERYHVNCFVEAAVVKAFIPDVAKEGEA